jgi:hypothetical protein
VTQSCAEGLSAICRQCAAVLPLAWYDSHVRLNSQNLSPQALALAGRALLHARRVTLNASQTPCGLLWDRTFHEVWNFRAPHHRGFMHPDGEQLIPFDTVTAVMGELFCPAVTRFALDWQGPLRGVQVGIRSFIEPLQRYHCMNLHLHGSLASRSRWAVNGMDVDTCRSRSVLSDVCQSCCLSRLYMGISWCEHLMEVSLGGRIVDARRFGLGTETIGLSPQSYLVLKLHGDPAELVRFTVQPQPLEVRQHVVFPFMLQLPCCICDWCHLATGICIRCRSPYCPEHGGQCGGCSLSVCGSCIGRDCGCAE